MKMTRRSYDEAEKELMQALADLPVGSGPVEICLTPELLRSFFDGLVTDEKVQRQILAHLSTCPTCRHKMSELRKRRLHLKWAACMVAAVIVIVVAILWIWPKWNAPHKDFPEIAVVDLGPKITRGIEDLPIKVSHTTRRFRIVLPSGSAAGSYEVALLAPQAKDSPILTTAAETEVANERQQLNINLDLESLPAGSYLLAIRHGNSGWVYRTLLVDPR
jgi:hypothetical protein